MAGIRVPAHLQDTAKEIGARDWARAKGFPRDKWFELVDDFKEKLGKVTGGDTPENKQVVALLAVVVDAEGALVNHVLKLAVAIADEGVWTKMCTAAAWVVLQEYIAAVEKGEWS